MNAFKKLLFQACLISCTLSGPIFTSDTEQNIPSDVSAYLANLHDQSVAQINQIQADIQHLIQLVTSKKLLVNNIEKVREELLCNISFLDAQKQDGIHMTIENIDKLALMTKVCIEYFLTHIPDKIDAISNKNLISKIQDFFVDLNSGKITAGSFEEIVAENTTQLKKLSYKCDTAGLTQINKLYKWLDKNNAFQHAYTTVMVGGTVLTIAALATYFAFQQKGETLTPAVPLSLGRETESPEFIAAVTKTTGLAAIGGQTNTPNEGFDAVAFKAFTQNMFGKDLAGYINTPVETTMSYVVEPAAKFAKSIGRPLVDNNPYPVLGILAASLAPNAKAIRDYCEEKWQNVKNSLSGETGSAKGFIQANRNNKIYFKDLIGAAHLEKLADQYIDYLKHPERYDSLKIAPSKGILLVGPPQTGKSLFAAALHTKIEDEFKDSGKTGFIEVNEEMLRKYTLEEIFAIAEYHAPCIIFIDEIDMIGVNRKKEGYNAKQLLTCMSGLNSASSGKKVFVLAATNRPENIDPALKKPGRFGKHIPFTYPQFAERKAILDRLNKIQALNISEDFIIQLTKETEGLSYNAITSIITQAMCIAKQAARLVKPADIDAAFDTEVRKIDPYETASNNQHTQKAVAAYQAGKVAAYILCNPVHTLVKVTIKPIIKETETESYSIQMDHKSDNSSELKKDEPFTKDSYKLGGVFTCNEIDASELQSINDQEHEIMCLLAGKISQEMLLGKVYNKVGAEDLDLVKAAVHTLSANPSITKDEMLKNTHLLEETLHAKIKDILYTNKDLVEKIYKALLEHQTLNRDMLKTFTA